MKPDSILITAVLAGASPMGGCDESVCRGPSGRRPFNAWVPGRWPGLRNLGPSGLESAPINPHRVSIQASVKSPSQILPFLAVVLAGLLLGGCGEPPKESAAGAGDSSRIKTACGMEMVFVPGGDFIMGVNEGPIDAKPAHPVKVEGFLMDQHEISQEVYTKVVGKNPSRQKQAKNPVEQVTWSDAVKFCNARSTQEGLEPCYDPQTWECRFGASGYRLPTEAEWEYACRAGTTNRYYFGEHAEDLKANAWFDGNSQSKPHPVAHWKPNAWGLYDMTGNVWEWCNDFYGVKYYRSSPGENPRGPKEGEKRVLRGGAWSSPADNCASWARNCDEAGFTDVCLTMDSNGFRCVRKASAAEMAARAPSPSPAGNR